MNFTGDHPSERVFPRSVKPHRDRFKLSACGIALAALCLGTGSQVLAEHQDPTKPRVERVRDTDGSIWEVEIVPRPLGRSTPIRRPAALRKASSQPTVPPSPNQKDATDEAKPKSGQPESDKPQPYEEKDSPAKAAKPEMDEAANRPAENKSKKRQVEDASASEEAVETGDESSGGKEELAEMPFGVEIVPRFSYPPQHAGEAVEEVCPPASSPVRIHPGDYSYVYNSIPFLRSEYIANPSYRHEATMEILFGKLRPTVVHKHPGRPRPHGTMFPHENAVLRPYSYYSLAPGAGYGRGPLPYAAPGAYGVNYNFYYPMPTVYRSY